MPDPNAELVNALADTYTAPELNELRELLIEAWVVPGTGNDLHLDAPQGAGALIDALALAEARNA